MRLPWPATLACTGRRLMFQRRLVTLWAWLMRFPACGFLPQISHCCAMTTASDKEFRSCGQTPILPELGRIRQTGFESSGPGISAVRPPRPDPPCRATLRRYVAGTLRTPPLCDTYSMQSPLQAASAATDPKSVKVNLRPARASTSNGTTATSRTITSFICATPAPAPCAMKSATSLAAGRAIPCPLRRARCRCSSPLPSPCPPKAWASTPSSSRGTIITISGCIRGNSCAKSAPATSAKRRGRRVNEGRIGLFACRLVPASMSSAKHSLDRNIARPNMSSTKPISAVQSVVDELLPDLHARSGCEKIGLTRESFAAILCDVGSKHATASDL